MRYKKAVWSVFFVFLFRFLGLAHREGICEGDTARIRVMKMSVRMRNTWFSNANCMIRVELNMLDCFSRPTI